MLLLIKIDISVYMDVLITCFTSFLRYNQRNFNFSAKVIFELNTSRWISKKCALTITRNQEEMVFPDIYQVIFFCNQRCSVKKVFLEISQNSQENTCARVSFLNKGEAWGIFNIKRWSVTCWVFPPLDRYKFLLNFSLFILLWGRRNGKNNIPRLQEFDDVNDLYSM